MLPSAQSTKGRGAALGSAELAVLRGGGDTQTNEPLRDPPGTAGTRSPIFSPTDTA